MKRYDITLRLTVEVCDDEDSEDAKDVVREWIAGSSNLPWACKEMYIVGEHFNMDLPVDQNKTR